jgi:hypothetical protein
VENLDYTNMVMRLDDRGRCDLTWLQENSVGSFNLMLGSNSLASYSSDLTDNVQCTWQLGMNVCSTADDARLLQGLYVIGDYFT